MSVEGNLDLFQLPEILQVIAQQQKTGILTVQGPQDIVAISFLQGKIVAADALNQAAEEGLRKVLVGSGLLAPSEFSRAASEQLSSGQRLIDLLVERRFVSRPRLLEALRVQTIALLEQLLDWREGDFKFYGGDEVSFEEGFVPIAVTELLLHAGGSEPAPAPVEPRKGRGGKGEAGPPAEALRPSVAPGPSSVDRTASRDGGELLRPIGSMGPTEPQRPVVVPFPTPATSPPTQGSAQTLPSFSAPSLSGSGGIRKVVVEPVAVPTSDRWVGRALALLVAIPLLIGFTFGSARIALPFPWQGKQRAAIAEAQRKSLFLKVDRAAKTYYLLRGSFPEQLGRLRALHLLAPSEPRDPSGADLRYEAGDASYKITPLSRSEAAIPYGESSEGIVGNFLLDPEFRRRHQDAATAPIFLIE